MDAFGKTISAIVAVVLIFIFPLQYLADNHSHVVDNFVNIETTKLADSAMLQGFITLEEYEAYLNKLDLTGQLYDIEIIHSKPTEGYTSNNNNDITALVSFENKSSGTIAQGGFTFLSPSTKSYETITTDVKNPSGSIQLMAAHVHTDACYVGHNHAALGCSYHSHWGSSTTGTGCYSKPVYHTHNSSCYVTSPCGSTVTPSTYSSGNYYCSVHKKNDLTITAYSYCGNGHYHGSSIYKPCLESAPASFTCTQSMTKLVCSTDTSKPISYTINCGTSEGYTCGYSGDYNPICSTVVTSITATNPTQTVIKGAKIVTTANVTYLDGHTGVVTCTSNYNGAIGNQTVTLSYSGKIYNAKTNGSITTTTLVTTKSPVTYGLILIPSKTQIYKGEAAPTYTLVLRGSDNSEITITSGYTITSAFSPSTIGVQTITYNYMYDDVLYTASCTVEVKPNVTSLEVTPSAYTVNNGTEPTYKVTVKYENGTSQIVTNYTKTGFSNGAGVKSVEFFYTENGFTVHKTITIIVQRNTKTCINGHIYELNDFDGDFGCPICKISILKIEVAPTILTVNKGDKLEIILTAIYMDNHTEVIANGWTSNFKNDVIGPQFVTIVYEGHTDTIQVNVMPKYFICPICGTNYEPNYDGSDPGCPICSAQVISLIATPHEQIVELGKEINLTVTATFKDGSNREIEGWISDYNASIAGEQQVTIFYHSVSTTVNVTVTSDALATCPICRTNYNPKLSPSGCPICSKTIEKIEAHLSDDNFVVQYGSDLNLSVILIYKNGNKEYANGGWSVTGYNPVKLGQQTITVHYKGFSDNLTIEVVNTLGKTTCINGHVYYLNTDGSDPGCLHCSLDQGIGSSQNYYINTYTADVLKALYSSGVYYFEKGDYITITIIPKPNSILVRLKRIFFNNNYLDKKFSYGGLVHYGLSL